ncbi:hypothetical protein SGLAM104S_05502 [Streptomyces glaucescens]
MGDRRVHGAVRRADAGAGRDRRQVQPPRRPGPGPAGLRGRLGDGQPGRRDGPGHRRPRRHGRRRRRGHAGHTVPAGRDLPEARTGTGHHGLDGHLRPRHRRRPAAGGLAAGGPRLGLDLPDQRARRRRRRRRRLRPRTAVPGAGHGPDRLRGRSAVDRLRRLPGLRHHRGSALRLGHRPDRGGPGRGRRVRRLHAVGAEAPSADARRAQVRAASVQRLDDRGAASSSARSGRSTTPRSTCSSSSVTTPWRPVCGCSRWPVPCSRAPRSPAS